MTDEAPSSPARALDVESDVRDAEVRALVERAARVPDRMGAFSIVLIICSLLLALGVAAVPRFISFNCRSLQSEAKTNLKAILVARRAYAAEFERSPRTFAECGFVPKGGVLRYAYALAEDGAVATATAEGGELLKNDTWVLDEDGAVHNVVDGCAR